MAAYNSFKEKVDSLIGINLDYYKETQMKRRIKSLMKRNGYKDFNSYYIGLTENEELLDRFINHLTINVSEFYRNPSQWKVLEKRIIPSIRENNFGRLNVWSSACSTGEEPYSLVMLLSEIYPLRDIRVLATDIDMGAINKAKEGIYVGKALENLPEKYIEKYFVKENGVFKISREIKDRVEFKRLDLLKDPFPRNMDLIACRNVMIYFTDEAKDKLYDKFNYALKDYGVLFVGSTEQIIMPERYSFESVETFFYRPI